MTDESYFKIRALCHEFFIEEGMWIHVIPILLIISTQSIKDVIPYLFGI